MEPSTSFAADAESIGALADPVRLALYRFVVAAPEPVSRDQAAEGVGVPHHQARFHLDRLEADGLLTTSRARLTGRTGPGAGRPAKLYSRAPREFSVTLPERRYELAGRLLSDAVAESARAGTPVLDAVERAFTAHGTAAGRAATVREGDPLDVTADVLVGEGYEPRRVEDEVHLLNCPFHALAQTQTELVCHANLCLVAAVADEVGRDRVVARLEPRPDRCCVVLGSAL
ncbi:metalloregulator ArsR/SmtB family transcription factor [Cellulomonas sp. URHD0024]|uniref:helix-turn-helix transcriptional regulator n=1 Tax=Cellulomonas sp. URHD0024 TaxID=1302620 RepID=UPI000400C9EC|nr:helix-turn-helix domain-containing protein [Cellulomonas sp. URHD0024]